MININVSPHYMISRQFRRWIRFYTPLIFLISFIIYASYLRNILVLSDNSSYLDPHPPLITLKYTTRPSKLILSSNIPGISAIFSAVLIKDGVVDTPDPLKPTRTENMRLIEMQTGIQINYFAAIRPLDEVFKDNYDLNGWSDVASDTKRLNQAGCHFSHVAIWHEIVARNLEFTLIFEDDIDIEQMFKYKMQEIYAHENEKWPDLLMLGHCMTRGENDEYISPLKRFYCTHAYGVTLSGAKILLRHLDHFQFAPVDLAMRYVVENGHLDAKGLFPPIVRQLPRAYYGGGSVSGDDELPEQLLEDPVIMQNDVYKTFLVKKEEEEKLI